MIRKHFFGLFFLVLFPFLTQVAYADGDSMTGDLNFFLGSKALKSSDWAPAENEGEVAVEWAFKQKSWPIHAVVGLRSAHGSGTIGALTF